MKNAMLCTALVSMLAVAPAASFAQQATGGGLTRAQVRQELIDLESVGYRPASANQVTYPQDVQAAMQRLADKRANDARIAQQNGGHLEQSGYGDEPAAPSASGGPVQQDAATTRSARSLYSHH